MEWHCRFWLYLFRLSMTLFRFYRWNCRSMLVL